MPYNKVTDLPDAVKELPAHAQDIYLNAFNSAFKQYGGDESKSHATAWAAVKDKYEQDDSGNWKAKEAQEQHPHGDHVCVCPECGAETTVAEDVKCNTQKCPECGVSLRAATTGKRRENMPKAKESLSMENKRQLLQTAITDRFKTGDDWPYVEDIFDSEIVYNMKGQSYKIPYTLGEDGAVTLGEPKKVVRQTVYAPIESLRQKYAGIIQEIGKRNASTDSSRIKKIMELCQELLSSEEPEEKKTKEAVREAEAVLLWLQEQAATKTEDGENYPGAAFAYVPDAEKPSTWKLRLWEDPTKKVTRAQLGRAAAALSPGGFRGQKVDIPSEDMSAVKRKIRAAYRSLDVDDADIPKWVKESEVRGYVHESIEIPIEEVSKESLAKGILPVRIIQPGFNTSKSRYYTEAAISDAARVFDGAQMFANHQTAAEERERPEGDIRDWVAVLETNGVSDKGNAVGTAKIHAPWFKEMALGLYEQGTLDKLGVSIRATGKGVKGTVDGVKTHVIEGLTSGRSVDFVTLPGAGGIAGLKEAVELTESDDMLAVDIELTNLDTLRERRPDLVREIESAAKAEILNEVKKVSEQEDRIKDLEGQVETLTTERDELKTKAEEADKEKAKAEAQAIIKEAVQKAELPDAAKTRLLEQFKDAETADGIETAVEAEKTYIATLSEAGKVKGLGPNKGENTEDSHKALVESFKDKYLSEGKPEDEAQKLAEIAAGAR